VFNRINIRGVHAAVAAVGLAVIAAVLGPAVVASGAETDHRTTAPMPIAEQRALMHWDLPDVSFLRHVHPVHRTRPHQEVASRTTSRAPLTGDPRAIAHALLLREGGSETQWSCLDVLWSRESGWSTYASNGSSGAYGIPQALPGAKMAGFGTDWRTNPITQIRWGLWYIAQTYGTPCAALGHSQAYGYY
jgi:hypothetical protein